MAKPDDDYDEKYTDPDLRREIKAELMKGDKGGDPGEWSARKSQMLVREYEKRGGGYKKDEKDNDAKSLEEWTDQEWQTRDGDADATAADGATKRYLPERAWELLSDDEKDRTDRKKREEGEDAAKQYVANTVEAKAARAYVDHGDASELSEDQLNRLTKAELDDLAAAADLSGRSSLNKADLAPHVDVDLGQMERDAAAARKGRAVVTAAVTRGRGAEEVARFLVEEGGL